MRQENHSVQEKPHVLIVDDDNRLRTLLKKFLGGEGFAVTTAENAKEARQCLEYFRFDSIVLDVMMPGESGIELAASLRDKELPVLMLSALGESQHRIEGLEAGALDYLGKPFEPRELVLRLKSIMRRAQESAAAKPLGFGPYLFDRARQKLLRGAAEVALTTAELQLLGMLLGHAGTPVARAALAGLSDPPASERSVDVQITRLRKKLDTDGGPSLVRTVRGAGYVIYTQ